MARITKLSAIARSGADTEQRELLGLEDLPVETSTRDVYLDLDRIESFTHTTDESGEITEGFSDVIMHTTYHITIALSPEDLFKLINDGK